MKPQAIRNICVISLMLGTLPSSNAQEAVPAGMTYQGRITGTDGSPAPDSTGYAIEVRLWNAPTDGTLVWGASYTDVAVHSGTFNLILGATGGEPIAGAAINDLTFAFADSERYLGITVMRDHNGKPVAAPTEILPRQQILSVAYSISSDTARLADTATTAIHGIPTGSVLPYFGTIAPDGYLLCNGQAVSRTEYPNLFTALGTSQGNGDGTTTFNLPNLTGRFLVGYNEQDVEFDTLGEQGGDKSHHLKEAEIPPHRHTIYASWPGGSGSAGNGMSIQARWAANNAAKFENAIDNNGTLGDNPYLKAESFSILPPYTVVRYIIKL